MKLALVTGFVLAFAITFDLATRRAALSEGPQIVLEPSAGNCDLRPIVHGTGFPPDTPLELLVGSTAPTPLGQLAADVEFMSDSAGSFDVPTSDEFGHACLRNPTVGIVIGAGRFPDGHRADIELTRVVFNGPAAPATGATSTRPRKTPPLVELGYSLVVVSMGSFAALAARAQLRRMR